MKLVNKLVFFSIISILGFAYADEDISKNLTLINSKSLPLQLTKLEKISSGHIGLSAIDTGNNIFLEYNANQRFPMGCTSKVIGVSAILKQSMANETLLQDRIYYKESDLTGWAPVTSHHLKDGMTVKELSEAAIEQSDNTAMNLLVTKLGGLDKINQFAKAIGNNSFRQDRNWPDEALAVPGEELDTSTPHDMARSLQTLLFGNVLAKPERENLQSWMLQCKTGDKRIRSGIPKGWIVADKTGTGFYYAVTNDIAVVWPLKCKPIILAVYYHRNTKNAAKREDVLGKVAHLTLEEFAKQDQCLQNALREIKN